MIGTPMTDGAWSTDAGVAVGVGVTSTGAEGGDAPHPASIAPIVNKLSVART